MGSTISIKKIFILFTFFFLIFCFTSGGRIASSDETAFFLETQSIVEHFTLAIPDSIINNGAYGPDGNYYFSVGLTYSILGIPFYLLGKAINYFFSIPPEYHTIILKGSYSLINQFICALLGVVFFMLNIRFNFSDKISFILTGALLFSTNLFPYAKSAIREPATTLCLIAIFYCLWMFKINRKLRWLHYTGMLLVGLIHLKISNILFIPVFVLYFVLIYDPSLFTTIKNIFKDIEIIIKNRYFWKDISPIFGWLIFGVLLVLLNNYWLWGNAFSNGYSHHNKPFSNPLLVGLYGLLFSSGKSLFLYAPITIIGFASLSAFSKLYRFEALTGVLIFLISLVIHAKLFCWAADGSWGPRYLIPVIPFLIMFIGIKIDKAFNVHNRISMWFTGFLILIGLIIQIGGLSVYLGSYHRYLGEYPYTTSFTDPEFLYKSHFIPNYSPVTGHWQLLLISAKKHWDGEMNDFRITGTANRLPLNKSDQTRLVYIIDFWFMYMYYAGVKIKWIVLLVIISALLVFLSGWKTVMCIWKRP
jgi:hypothetical protein